MPGITATALSAAFVISSLTATEVIRAGDRITTTNTESESGDDDALIGREVRRTVYVGQEIDRSNTQAPRLVTRNQTVTMKYRSGALEITTTGRAMGEAAAGETVSVMNVTSRQLVTGVVTDEGWILAQ